MEKLLANHTRSISCHIILVINALRGGHTRDPTNPQCGNNITNAHNREYCWIFV